ncbi:hypothetical protein [Methylacidiphilum sp. Yel]|uniref:hypothetical protein n=1 Tax=Methylacidiphilum sp. Yel TaxID=1847730 RepID=UPI00141B9D07|nr:hypothetical protein [Methylacidiphilum sp. Yel]
MKNITKILFIVLSLSLAFGPICGIAKPKAEQVQDESKPEKKTKKHKKEKKEEKKEEKK